MSCSGCAARRVILRDGFSRALHRREIALAAHAVADAAKSAAADFARLRQTAVAAARARLSR